MIKSEYYHVDVFAQRPLTGNGLTVVFPETRDSSAGIYLGITQEFNQFETIFLFPREDVYEARVFTRHEELPFAGHPLLGAAAVIHRKYHLQLPQKKIIIFLKDRSIELISTAEESGQLYNVELDQGSPVWGALFPEHFNSVLAEALGLEPEDFSKDLPIQTVSTGLPYLLIPVRSGLERMSIQPGALDSLLQNAGAHFTYLFDPETLECRSWDNMGRDEDAATGSAAGPLIAYLNKYADLKNGNVASLKQGRFLNRPSTIEGWMTEEGQVKIRGQVAFFAEGTLLGK